MVFFIFLIGLLGIFGCVIIGMVVSLYVIDLVLFNMGVIGLIVCGFIVILVIICLKVFNNLIRKMRNVVCCLVEFFMIEKLGRCKISMVNGMF